MLASKIIACRRRRRVSLPLRPQIYAATRRAVCRSATVVRPRSSLAPTCSATDRNSRQLKGENDSQTTPPGGRSTQAIQGTSKAIEIGEGVIADRDGRQKPAAPVLRFSPGRPRWRRRSPSLPVRLHRFEWIFAPIIFDAPAEICLGAKGMVLGLVRKTAAIGFGDVKFLVEFFVCQPSSGVLRLRIVQHCQSGSVSQDGFLVTQHFHRKAGPAPKQAAAGIAITRGVASWRWKSLLRWCGCRQNTGFVHLGSLLLCRKGERPPALYPQHWTGQVKHQRLRGGYIVPNERAQSLRNPSTVAQGRKSATESDAPEQKTESSVPPSPVRARQSISEDLLKIQVCSTSPDPYCCPG